MLVVLVGLNCDTSESRIALNIVWLTKEAVTCREAAFEKLFNIDLAACCCECEEVHIVDMNIAAGMSFRVLRIEHEHGIELLCAFRAVLEHCAHCGVAVDVCVFTLDVAVDRILECQVFVHLHKACVHFSALCTFSAIENIFFSCSCVAVFDESVLNCVLNFFNSWDVFAKSLSEIIFNLECQFEGCSAVFSAESLCGSKNSISDLFAVVRDFTSVSFEYFCDHGSSVIYTLRIQYLYNKLF